MAAMNGPVVSARFQRLAKESGWVMVGQIASVIGSLVMVRVLTEYLDPAQYGQLALGLTVAGLINQVVMGGVIASAGRFYSIAAEKSDLPGYMRATRYLLAIATVTTGSIALVLASGLLWLRHSQWLGLTLAALAFSVASGYSACFSSIQNAARHRAMVAFHSGLESWLKLLLAVGVMRWVDYSGAAVLLGFALSSMLTAGSQFYFLRRSIPCCFDVRPTSANWIRSMWLYALPFSVWGGFTWGQQVSDRWALQIFGAAEDVGRYAVVFQLGYVPIAMATGMALALVGPILYQRAGDAEDVSRKMAAHRLTWLIIWISLAVTMLVVGMAFFVHPWIFKLLAAARYASVSYLLPWVILAGGLFAAGQMLALRLMSEMQPATMTFAKITTAVLGVGMNVYGSAQFGVSGVVAAQVGFSAVYFLWMAGLTRYLPATHHQLRR